MYDRDRSEVLCATKFDVNSDLSKMYLGRIDMTRSDKIKVEERFPISEQGYAEGKLLLVQNVNYSWKQEQLNHSCPKHIISD